MSQFRQIKASAGSGKTYTLTGSFLALMAGASGASWQKAPTGCTLPSTDAGNDYGWQEILAITFTNKAAAEMRDRLLSRLKDHALAPSSARRRNEEEKFWTPTRARQAVDMLLRSYSALNIRTIDSLLHLMVRLSAMDFDLSPDFEPRFNEDDITGPIFDLMAEQARDGNEELAQLFRQACQQMLRSEKTHGFLGAERIRGRVLTMAKLMLKADGWSLRELATPQQAEHHLEEIVTGIQNNARELAQCITEEKLNADKRFLKALSACTDCAGRADALPDSAYLRKSSLDECLNKASKGKASLSAHALFESICADMNEVQILRKARRLMPFSELARAVFDRIEAHERRSGLIAASQVPQLAIRAGDDSEGVNELFCRMGSRITHILIDEFQDTSLDQWLALQPLATEALARGGSLTIVGDVKQAIYGWRGGDAALFDGLVQPHSPLLPLAPQPTLETLPHNWRSRERIVAWNNALFSPIGDGDMAERLLAPLADGADVQLLNEQAALLRNAFARASQSAEHCAPGGFVQLRTLPKGEENALLLHLLPDLVEKLGHRHPWGDICILTRNNAQASLVAEWLMARRIPVVTQGSLLLADQPVIAELVALLRFINDPDDDLAFWDAVRGEHLLPPLRLNDGTPLDSARLSEWAALRKRRTSLARQFSADFPDIWETVFAPLHDEAGLLTPYDAAMEVLRRWNVLERCRESEGFVRRFLEVLHNAEDQGISDLAGFLDFWTTNGLQEKAPLPESMDAVRVMTMHKSKGLEFDVVILPWLDLSSGKTSDDDAVFWPSRSTGVLAPLCREMGDQWLKHHLGVARESLHLVYVAMTRAVSELYCFLPDPERGGMAALLDELLAAQRPLLQEDGELSFWGIPPESSDTSAVAPDLPLPGDLTASSLSETEQQIEASASITPDVLLDSVETEDADIYALDDTDEVWRPMGWLPRLRMFRSQLDDWSFTARRRGTLIHHCLECLQVSGIGEASARRDAELAAARGISTFPLPIPDKEAVLADITEDLAWYAALPETPHWLAFGTPEHALLDADGRQYRVDLLVDDGDRLTAVEYKTGTAGTLPAPAHVEQLTRYLRLLNEASGLPVRGVLVYLDRRQIIPLSRADGTA